MPTGIYKRKSGIYTHTKETRKKIGDSNRGRKLGPMPQSVKDKISKNKLGCKFSEEHKRNISIARKGMKFTDTHKKNISIAASGHRPQIQGKKSHLWKGGVSSLIGRIKRLSEYRNWRKQIFERDNYTCQDCGKKDCYLEAHHIKSLSELIKINNITTLKEAILCFVLWDIDNGVTLCSECHKLTDNYGFKLANKNMNKGKKQEFQDRKLFKI